MSINGHNFGLQLIFAFSCSATVLALGLLQLFVRRTFKGTDFDRTMRLKASLLFSTPAAALTCIILLVVSLYQALNPINPPTTPSQSTPISLATSGAVVVCLSTALLICFVVGTMLQFHSMPLPTLRSLGSVFDSVLTSFRNLRRQ
jgi:ABC-type dipeptide/oligopeptide/nickel transport system permease component